MAIPQLRTWASGETATAAMMNANVRDAVNFLLNPPYLHLVNTTGIAIPNSAWTAVGWNRELIDNDGMHSTLSNTTKVVIATPGLYDIRAHGLWTSNSTGMRGIQVRLNADSVSDDGTRLVAGGSPACPGTETTTAVQVYQLCSPGDELEAFAYQTSGGSLNLLSEATGDQYSWFTVRWVAAS